MRSVFLPLPALSFPDSLSWLGHLDRTDGLRDVVAHRGQCAAISRYKSVVAVAAGLLSRRRAASLRPAAGGRADCPERIDRHGLARHRLEALDIQEYALLRIETDIVEIAHNLPRAEQCREAVCNHAADPVPQRLRPPVV